MGDCSVMRVLAKGITMSKITRQHAHIILARVGRQLNISDLINWPCSKT